jgi:hypothetical protein
MKLFAIVIAIVGLLLLSSCAPQLMSADQFPIKPGMRWSLNLASNPSVNHSFVLRGEPDRDPDYVSYDGVAGDKQMTAILYKNGLLAVIIFNETNKPFDNRNAVYCFLYQEGPVWAGNGLVGTFAKDVEPMSSSDILRQPRCEARPS